MANELRDRARELWEQSKGKQTLASIAGELDIPLPTVKSWKQRDAWGKDAQMQKDASEAANIKTKRQQRRASTNRRALEAIEANEDLTDRERDFCAAFVAAPNATQAAMATGRYKTLASASQAAYEMLQKSAVRAEIQRLKAIKRQALLADGDDVIDLHMRIAFADLTQFVEFGRETVPVMGMFGPVVVKDEKTGEETPVTQEVNTVRFKEHTQVDGLVLAEVKQGKNGASVKLADRQKSLDFLERYFQLNPMDRHKKDYELKRLELEQQKVAAETQALASSDAPYIPDAVWRELMNSAYAEQLTATQPVQVFFGGSSSGKSFGILGQRTVRDLLQGGRNYLICRKTGRTLRNSSFNEVKKCISRMDLEPYFAINKTDMVITCKPTGSQILFSGLDDPEKVKSITPAKGVITDVVIEEATEADYDDYKQLTKRLRGGDESITKRVTLLFNPVLQDHWIYEQLFAGRWDDSKNRVISDDLLILRTTYKDNRFLTADDIAKLENETDKYYYEVYTLGHWGVLGNLIFTKWETKDLTEIAKATHQFYNGQDFGFFPDPAAFVRVGYNRAKKEVYIFKELGGTDFTNDLLAEHLKPIIRREVLTCDNAEPKSIQELNNFGITAVPAVKGPGSLEFGIKWLQRQKIYVDPSCVALILELKKYKYREDRNGHVLPEPVDRDNHYIDALRYALESVMVEARIN